MNVRATALSVPTDGPGGVESDGTLSWDATGVVLVEVEADGVTGLGWTYADAAAAALVEGKLTAALRGRDPDDVGAAWMAMRRAVRNDGATGLVACAVSALDVALWDRFARARDTPLAVALGAFGDTVPVYGSGGFCNYDDDRLRDQLAGWAAAGMGMVKMKVGADREADHHRVAVARAAVGDGVQLFVDANGAYDRREAVRCAHAFAAQADVRWLEEPVSSHDRDGLRFVRDHAPAGLAVAAGEYAWGPEDARDLLAAGAVDVLQVDGTRCGGLTGFRAIAAMAWAERLAA
jgi:L-alanine-DL-glutamate epimerase-like enolase superfamily enzyme